MTDMELAEEIERRRGGTDMLNSVLMPHQWEQIIAALRRADLAQTEIKGHMRVEDELKVTVASLERKLDDIVNTMKHAGMKVPGWIEHTDQDGKLRRDNLTIAATLIFELEAWQFRIAELEKDAARLDWLHSELKLTIAHALHWPVTPQDTVSFRAKIDTALKVRA